MFSALFVLCLLLIQVDCSLTQNLRRDGQQQPGHSRRGSNPQKFPTSPHYPWIFQNPLPIPPIAQPIYEVQVNGRTIQYFELTVEAYEQQVYSNLGPAHLVGYNGTSPEPTFIIERDVETVVRVLNKASGAAAMHLHGTPSHAPWDGWAADLIEPESFKDNYYPNCSHMLNMVKQHSCYHDHVDGATAPDVYLGQAWVYIIHDPVENSLGLPKGKYNVPLAITDKSYQSNGDVVSPAGEKINFYGDIIHVNLQPWPMFVVEPRKHGLRFFEMSLSRVYDLYFVDDATDAHIEAQVIASDAGLFGSPVSTKDVVIAMGERYEVVIDFAPFKEGNVTLMNRFKNEDIDLSGNTDKVMRFVVGDTITSSANNGEVPSTLRNVNWPTNKDTVDHVFKFQHRGDALWTINGVDFTDVNNRVLARPQQGTVELWQLDYDAGLSVHPVHIHLVNFRVTNRTGSSRGVLPYEAAGLKDVILLEPGESVKVLAFSGPWNGMYMFHCHNLIHEDNRMLDVLNVIVLEKLGYNHTDDFANPVDPRYTPRPSSAKAFKEQAIKSTLSALGSVTAYEDAAQLAAAETAYYLTAGFPTESASAGKAK